MSEKEKSSSSFGKILIGIIIVAIVVLIILWALGVFDTSDNGSGGRTVDEPRETANIYNGSNYINNNITSNTLEVITSTSPGFNVLNANVVWKFVSSGTVGIYYIQSYQLSDGTVGAGNYISSTGNVVFLTSNQNDSGTLWRVDKFPDNNATQFSIKDNLTNSFNLYIDSNNNLLLQSNSSTFVWSITDPTNGDPTLIISNSQPGIQQYIWAINSRFRILRLPYFDPIVDTTWTQPTQNSGPNWKGLSVKNTAGGNNYLWLINENSNHLYRCLLPADDITIGSAGMELVHNTSLNEIQQLDASDSDFIWAVTSGNKLVKCPQNFILIVNGNSVSMPWITVIEAADAGDGNGILYVNISRFISDNGSGDKFVAYVDNSHNGSGNCHYFPSKSTNIISDRKEYNGKYAGENVHFDALCDINGSFAVAAISSSLYELNKGKGPSLKDPKFVNNILITALTSIYQKVGYQFYVGLDISTGIDKAAYLGSIDVTNIITNRIGDSSNEFELISF